MPAQRPQDEPDIVSMAMGQALSGNWSLLPEKQRPLMREVPFSATCLCYNKTFCGATRACESNPTMKKLIVSSVFALSVVASSSAISVDSKRLLGYFDSLAPTSLIDDLTYLNTLLDYHNGASVSLPSAFQLELGVDVPSPTIANPNAYASGGEEVRGVSIPISAGAYDWVSLKTGSKTEFYYIGDLSGSHTLFNGLLAGGAVADTAAKLQETNALAAEAAKAAQKLKGQTQKLDLEALALDAELKKQEKLKQDQLKQQQLLNLQQQILLAMQQLLQQQLADLDKAEQEKIKQKQIELLENQKQMEQKEAELAKLLQEAKASEEAKKKLQAANQKLLIEQMKKQQELQQQQKKQQALETEKKRLEELKKAQLAEAGDDASSHYNFFGEKQRSSVPDSGATVGLLAFALAALAGIRRRS